MHWLANPNREPYLNHNPLTFTADSNTHWVGDEPDIFREDGTIRCNEGHVYDQETGEGGPRGPAHCHYRLQLSCSEAGAGFFASLDKRLPTCEPAKCRMSELVVRSSSRFRVHVFLV